MRWRNQILALFCLTIFFALGVLYFRHWVVQKPFGIILFVGEGLTTDRIAAARLYAGGADSRLTIESLPSAAVLSNYSADFAVPDEAAAATALATGVKVNNGSIGIDPKGNSLASIIDLAREKGRATGLVTNLRLTNPTAAAFYARSAAGTGDVARQFADSSKIDIALGGGSSDFLPRGKGGGRDDGRDLMLELRRNGYEIVRTKAELEAIPRWRRPRLLGLFSNGELPAARQGGNGAEQLGLADMTRRAIELLEWNAGGYLLVVDAGGMGQAARQNAAEIALAETVELDRAVATAQIYSGEKSTLLVTGNFGTGGLTLSGFPFRRDHGVALLGVNPAGEPNWTWASGPNGAKNSHSFAQPHDASAAPENVAPMLDGKRDEPAASYAAAARNTAESVFAAGRGSGSEKLHGFQDNTVVFQIIRDQL